MGHAQENLTGSTERKSTTRNVARSSAEELIGALLVFEDGNLYGILPGSTYFRKMILVKDALQQTWLINHTWPILIPQSFPARTKRRRYWTL
jgi:hypothetical protein